MAFLVKAFLIRGKALPILSANVQAVTVAVQNVIYATSALN